MASKTIIGIVTYGGINFTKLAVESIRDTTTKSIDFYIIVGKPGDQETIDWLRESKIRYKIHDQNYGFPYGINDIYDYAWKYANHDNLIITGNDIVAYPYCIDSLINLAESSDYSVISALQYDVRSLVKEFSGTKSCFKEPNFQFTDFSKKPWEVFKDYSSELSIASMQLYDIQNCCLYKKEYFKKVGYLDINYYPAYYVDNDLAKRIINSGIKCCSLTNARFFHFWSRVINQLGGGSNSHYFENNRKYYISKWGGEVGKETKVPETGIFTREHELEIIEFWKKH